MSHRDDRRRFNDTERVDLYLAAGGHCETAAPNSSRGGTVTTCTPTRVAARPT